jgi:hypothetical protein
LEVVCGTAEVCEADEARGVGVTFPIVCECGGGAGCCVPELEVTVFVDISQIGMLLTSNGNYFLNDRGFQAGRKLQTREAECGTDVVSAFVRYVSCKPPKHQPMDAGSY